MKVFEITYKWVGGQYPNAEHEEVARKEIGSIRLDSTGIASWRKYRHLMNAKTVKKDAQPFTTLIVTEDGRTIRYPVTEYANVKFVPLRDVLKVR